MNNMEDNNKTVSLSLGNLGLITWIVFMIMDYGCHMNWIVNANNAIKMGGHFWTWFPLWAPLALALAIIIVVIIFKLIFREE